MFKIMVTNQDGIEYLNTISESFSLQLYVLRSNLKRGAIIAWKIKRSSDDLILAQSK